jgi:hemolysin activation/secretion protein
VLFDVNAPPINIGYFPTANGDVPANLRCSWFMDYGQAYRIDRSASYAEQVGGLSRHQWGTGAGFFLTAGEHFDARLTLGWALLGNPENSAGSAQAYFSVGFQF